MSFFDPNEEYPKTWKEMSLEYRLMFVYHVCMMVLFIRGGSLSVRTQWVIAGILILSFTGISLSRRGRKNWHWQGVKGKNLLMALSTVILLSFFLFAATPLFPPSNSRSLPWYLAGIGIGLFGVLKALRLVHLAESQFSRECGGESSFVQPSFPQTTAISRDPRWHRAVHAAYTVAFIAVWLAGVTHFYYFGTSFRDGSRERTATHTEQLDNHGETVYVPLSQKRVLDRLQVITFAGIPTVILGGLALHFLVGVKLFPNAPTLKEYRERRSQSSQG